MRNEIYFIKCEDSGRFDEATGLPTYYLSEDTPFWNKDMREAKIYLSFPEKDLSVAKRLVKGDPRNVSVVSYIGEINHETF